MREPKITPGITGAKRYFIAYRKRLVVFGVCTDEYCMD
jgi:hypothetical protein